MTEPRYKDPELRDEFLAMPPLLMEISQYFIDLSLSLGVDPMVTRVKEGICGDSGVHEAGRGIDFRDQTENQRLYTDDQAQEIAREINSKYARSDGKMTCLHHSFQGGPYHFHLQQAADLSVYQPKQGELA